MPVYHTPGVYFERRDVSPLAIGLPRADITGFAGITMRGVDLNSFDHFVNQINGPDSERTGLPTLFFPMTRVERIALDESSGSIPSLSEVFARKVGRPIAEYLAQFV